MITANELKTRGVKAIEEGLKNNQEVTISVRGKVKYVAITVEQYDEMRAAEIKAAYHEVMEDVKEGRYTVESADSHVKRLWSDKDASN